MEAKSVVRSAIFDCAIAAVAETLAFVTEPSVGVLASLNLASVATTTADPLTVAVPVRAGEAKGALAAKSVVRLAIFDCAIAAVAETLAFVTEPSVGVLASLNLASVDVTIAAPPMVGVPVKAGEAKLALRPRLVSTCVLV